MAHSLYEGPGAPTATSTIVNDQSPTNVRHCEWRLPAVLSSVVLMRRRMRGLFDDSALADDAIEDLLLAASEAANNAVEHAQRPTEPFFDVCAEVGDEQVTIIIRDYGGWRQQTLPSDRGRGLAMMRALGDTTVTICSHGTTVTIRSHCAGPGAMGDADRAP